VRCVTCFNSSIAAYASTWVVGCSRMVGGWAGCVNLL
jgi:hypothetical protein